MPDDIWIDCSNYQGYPTANQAIAIKDVGVKGAIIGCQRQPIAIGQFLQFINVGLEIEWYFFPTEYQIQNTRNLLDLYGPRQAWVDCEDGSMEDGETADHFIARIQHISFPQNIFPPDIYTRESWWRENLHNTTVFSNRKLWTADPHDGNPRPSYNVNYGGWNKAHTIQYTGSTEFAGFGLDFNQREQTDMNEQISGMKAIIDNQQNKIQLAAGILGDKYRVERLSDNTIGEKVFVLHLSAGGDPEPPIIISV